MYTGFTGIIDRVADRFCSIAPYFFVFFLLMSIKGIIREEIARSSGIEKKNDYSYILYGIIAAINLWIIVMACYL